MMIESRIAAITILCWLLSLPLAAEETHLDFTQLNAEDVAGLPEFAGPTPGVPRTITIPTIDISSDTARHSIVARGTPDTYHGHCDTVLLPDGKTMFTAWTVDHAQRIGCPAVVSLSRSLFPSKVVSLF